MPAVPMMTPEEITEQLREQVDSLLHDLQAMTRDRDEALEIIRRLKLENEGLRARKAEIAERHVTAAREFDEATKRLNAENECYRHEAQAARRSEAEAVKDLAFMKKVADERLSAYDEATARIDSLEAHNYALSTALGGMYLLVAHHEGMKS